MLVRHFSDINEERVVLIYSIVTGKSLDLGKFLSSHIIQCAKHSSMSLFYLPLITAMCVASGIQYGPNEESLAPMSAITNNKVQAMKENDRMRPVVQGSQARRQSSSSRPLTMAERMERLEGQVTHQGKQLQQLIDYQYSSNNTIAEIMRMLVIGMVVDMSQFPTMPVFSGRPQPEEHAFSQPMEGDGDVGGDKGDDEELQ